MNLHGSAHDGQQGSASSEQERVARSTWNIGARLRRLAVWLLSLPIYAYRICLSPLLPPACRHEPTCSRYALEALAVHGPWRGLLLAVGRILRCHPWGTFGPDPVPPPSPPSRRRKPVVISS